VTHTTPWGAAINFDGPHSDGVRRYVVDNAVAWVREFHLDGLRLDATHAIVDESARHILADLAQAIEREAAAAGRPVPVIAEDARNLAHIIQPEAAGGWGLDAVWSDDFHHHLRRRLAGDSDGYFQDFAGRAVDIAATARRGWFFHGQFAEYFGRSRGTDPAGIPRRRFVFFMQNHDQVGNRAMGDRLHHQVAMAPFLAASTLLLVLPETPLLFMGQEWAASSPWRFFTDHNPELGAVVREGRRAEFARFAAFSDPATRETIPDPQAMATFESSRLDWDERHRSPHQETLTTYRHLLHLRRTEPALSNADDAECRIEPWSDDVLLVRREWRGAVMLAVIRLEGAGRVDLAGHPLAATTGNLRWDLLFSTAADGSGVVAAAAGRPAVDFGEPGAVMFTARGARG
jgi:maltooligosyltrehalose trehalohydrolase